MEVALVIVILVLWFLWPTGSWLPRAKTNWHEPSVPRPPEPPDLFRPVRQPEGDSFKVVTALFHMDPPEVPCWVCGRPKNVGMHDH